MGRESRHGGGLGWVVEGGNPVGEAGRDAMEGERPARRAICPVCLYNIRITDEGTLANHKDGRWERSTPCPGSGHKPPYPDSPARTQ